MTTDTALTGRPDTTSYDELGPRTAEPGLLLVPGWCGGREVFDPLGALLAEHRRTLVTDLLGHGRRPSVADVTTDDVIDDLVGLLDDRGAERVVPVTLSHAGWAAVALRERLGAERVPGVVLVDWMPLGTPPAFADALDGLQSEQHWEQVRAALTGMWLEGVENPDVRRYVASMTEYGFAYWSRAGREIAAGFDTGTPVQRLADLGPCPTLHLYAQPADPAYLGAQRAFAADHPWFQVRRLDAVSHFPMLEVPATMAAEIEEFACSLA